MDRGRQYIHKLWRPVSRKVSLDDVLFSSFYARWDQNWLRKSSVEVTSCFIFEFSCVFRKPFCTVSQWEANSWRDACRQLLQCPYFALQWYPFYELKNRWKDDQYYCSIGLQFKIFRTLVPKQIIGDQYQYNKC